MLEGYIHAIAREDPQAEIAAKTRERLKTEFPPGTARRMSQLGMMVGSCLGKMNLQPDETLVYLTEYGEARSLEAFLDSFPSASPTAFQSSIHPSGVQQSLIARQFVVREFFPMVGRTALIPQALVAANVSPGPRTVICGGEEEGTWLREAEGASDRSFAFAFATSVKPDNALAHWRLRWSGEDGELTLAQWSQRLGERVDFKQRAGSGWELEWEWANS